MYQHHRKNHCDNIDGRLGFTCTVNIPAGSESSILEIDRIDGNPANNSPENLQTLCRLCAAAKRKIAN